MRQGLLIRTMGGGEPRLIDFDQPAPVIMADGIGGVCRRGWQYAIIGGTTLVEAGVVPREGGPVDSAAELAAIRAYDHHPETAVPGPVDDGDRGPRT